MPDKRRAAKTTKHDTVASTSGGNTQRTLLDVFAKKHAPAPSSQSSDGDHSVSILKEDRKRFIRQAESAIPVTNSLGQANIARWNISKGSELDDVNFAGDEGKASKSTQRLVVSTRRDGSQHDPIVLDSFSPPNSRKALAALFVLAPPKLPSRSSPNKMKAVKGIKLLPDHFPDAESQHVRGKQSTFLATSSWSELYPRGVRNAANAFESTSTFMNQLSNGKHSLDGSNLEQHKRLLPFQTDYHLEQDKVFARTQSKELWTEKYRPRKAEEVLGNVSHAQYLRDWLLTLELQLLSPETNSMRAERVHKNGNSLQSEQGKTKRPRIVRSIVKQRGRKKQRLDSDEDNWIVGSSESEDDPFMQMENKIDVEMVEHSKPLKRLRKGDPSIVTEGYPPKQAPMHEFGPEVTNTILLHGPCGSGKTAAVYACAEELGFDVFEVYPGIGKRNASNLDQLIGNVGSNHSVRKSTATTDSSNDITSMFERSTVSSHPHDLVKSNSNISIKPKQSLILLEEADILFREDIGFWAAVVKIIKDCRRPVVITCNDVSLIPVIDLPLQKILTFEPCSRSEAINYLHNVCKTEGKPINNEDLFAAYADIYALDNVDVPDMPLHPFTLGLPQPDIRRSLNYLQFDSLARTTRERLISSPILGDLPRDKSLGQLLRQADVASWVDCYLSHTQLDVKAMVEYHTTSADDLVGHTLLQGNSECIDTPFVEEACKTLEAIRDLASGICNTSMHFTTSNDSLFDARVRYQSAIVEVLNDVIPLSGPMLPRPPTFLEYIPWLRIMVAIDDEFESIYVEEQRTQAKRATRNSRRYYREMDFNADQLGILASTALLA